MAKMTLSPLRYPGGKNVLYDYVEKLIIDNNLLGCTYIEPYTGGGSIAIRLLKENIVDRIIINDFDRSIYAFWYCVLNYTAELCNRISSTEINMNTWHEMKKIQDNKSMANILDLAFSTLFLNRTNISGIIKAGVIGGKEQKGTYKMDCRFNKKKIIDKILNIAEMKDNIILYNYDTIDLINNIVPQVEGNKFIFFDPPYYKKGSTLYVNFYKKEDHIQLKQAISNIDNSYWIVTYDNVPEIVNLYNNYRSRTYSLTYTVNKPRSGSEIMFYSNNLHE